MGYETRITLVSAFNFPSERIKTGVEILTLDLCKVGYHGPLVELIENSKSKEPVFGLYARTPDCQIEAVNLLRNLIADKQSVQDRAYQLWEEAGRPCGRDREFWYQAEAEFGSNFVEVQGYTNEEIIKLSNNLEDGIISKDSYGDCLGVIEVDDFLEALRAQMKLQENDPYRRFEWALRILESVIATWPNYKEYLKIITYGH